MKNRLITKKYSKSKHALFLRFAVLGFAASVLVFFIWIYAGKFTETKKNLAVFLNLPAASVNGRIIFARNIEQISRLIKASELDKKDISANDIYERALDKAVESEQIIALANKLIINNKSSDFEEYLGYYKNDLQSQSAQAGVSQSNFIRYVIEPVYYENKLRTWYNGKEELNPEVFKAMKEAQRKHLLGESFENLAAKYNENEMSSKYAGDNGFVKAEDFDPEIRNEIINIPPGQNRILANSDGLLLVVMHSRTGKPDDNNTLFHVGEILMKETGFDIWLKNSLEKQSIIRFL